MKITKALLLTSVFGVLGGVLISCGGTPQGGSDTIQIRAYKAGYGIDWLNEIIDKFQQAYPGKKVEIVEASSIVGDSAMKEIYVPSKNNIDLYFLADGQVSQVVADSAGILKKPNGVLYEDLTDVFNSKAIGFDGKEESETIASRMFDGYKEYSTYVGYVTQHTGKMFTLPWADGVLGIAANPAVLEKYDIDYNDILTSDDLVDAIETIYNDPKTAPDGRATVKPYVWAGNNAAGYWTYLYETWFAQYTGVSKYQDFIKCTPRGDGKFYDEGYKVYQDEGILKSLEGMFDILDLDYSVDGSNGMKHTEAQTRLIKGEAAFMVTGDWLLNEMKSPEEYFNLTKECVMMRTPILSAIGPKIGLSEEQLKAVIKLIDLQGKAADNEAIKEAVKGVNDVQIEKVREARSTHDSLGTSHNIVVPSYSDAIPLVKQFLRFMYSNDGCRVFRNKAYMNLPLRYTPADGDSNTTFQKSLDKIYNYPEAHMISGCGELNDVRKMTTMLTFNKSDWSSQTTFKTIMADKEKASPMLSPEKIFTQEGEYMKQNWKSVFMARGGYTSDY